ncbi:MAG TPA: hypothetical protein VIL98_03065 [Gaiellaceae bacterium]
MRGLTVGVASLAALVLASAVWAAPPPSPVLAQPVSGPISSDPATASGPGATVRLSTSKAGARPVILTIRIVAPLRCGVPFGLPVVVSLPRLSLVPQAIASSAVLINGKQSSKVTVSAHSVTVGVPTVHGVTCNSISDGPELLTFTSAAKLGNARKPGTYAITVRRGSSTYAASVTIS